MQRNNLAEDYDLDGVTARLEAMEARRRRWQSRKNEHPEQQLVEGGITTEFDLASADLSSGDDSDDEYESNSTNSLPSDDDKAKDTRRYSRTSKQQRGRGRPRGLRVTDSLDLSMSVAMSDVLSVQTEAVPSTNQRATRSKLPRKESMQNSSHQDIHAKAVSSVKSEYSAVNKISRIPKLVQQRRQLQADAAASLHAGDSSHAPPSDASCRVSANKGQRRNSPPIGEKVAVPEPPKDLTAMHSTRSPTHGTSKPKDSISIVKLKADGVAVNNVPEEIDLTTAEERRLLQSIEKLDQRLTNVCVPVVAVREGGQQTLHTERTLNKDTSRVRGNTEISSSAYAKVDDEKLRAGAYGGGTHCKLHQPAPVSVRSSSAKRAELSSGVHKARVRVGGAFINDSRRNSSTDGNGKHKIVVKKDLAHLLF